MAWCRSVIALASLLPLSHAYLVDVDRSFCTAFGLLPINGTICEKLSQSEDLTYAEMDMSDLPGGCLLPPKGEGYFFNKANFDDGKNKSSTFECGKDGWKCKCFVQGVSKQWIEDNLGTAATLVQKDKVAPDEDIEDPKEPQTPASTNPPEPSQTNSETYQVGVIVGGVVAGIFVVILLVCIYQQIHKRPKIVSGVVGSSYNKDSNFEEESVPTYVMGATPTLPHHSPKMPGGFASNGYPSPFLSRGAYNAANGYPSPFPSYPSPEWNYLGPSLSSPAAPQQRPSSALEHRFSTYVLQRKLSSGGFFSDVYLAMDVGTEKPVAIKAISDDCFMSGDFISEINFLEHAQHENLVKMVASFVVDTRKLLDTKGRGQLQDPNRVWRPDCGINAFKSFSPDIPRVCIVLEYLEGGSLSNYIANLYRTQTYLELIELVDFAMQMSSVVYYLHRSALRNPIAHCDIKPDNILLSKSDDGSRQYFKLVDMGMSFVKNQTRKLESLRYKSAFIPSWFTFKDLHRPDAKPLCADAYAIGTCILKLASLDTAGEDVKFDRKSALDRVETQYGTSMRNILERCSSDTWASQMHVKEVNQVFTQWWNNLRVYE